MKNMHDKFSKTIEITKKPSFFGFFFWKFGAKITNILAETDIFNFFFAFFPFFPKSTKCNMFGSQFHDFKASKRKSYFKKVPKMSQSLHLII